MALISRDSKIADLKTKLTYWHSADGQKKFVNEVRYNKNFPPAFGTMVISGGYYYLSDQMVGFYDTTVGHSIRIKKLVNGDIDYNCFMQLQEIANVKKTFRTSRITHRQKLVIDGQDWEYAEIASPNGEYGENYLTWILNSFNFKNGLYVETAPSTEEKTAVTDKFKRYADEIIAVSKEIENICVKNNTQMPQHMLNLPSIYSDSLGMYWAGLEQSNWIMPLTPYKNRIVDLFENTSLFLTKTRILQKEEAAELVDYVTTALEAE